MDSGFTVYSLGFTVVVSISSPFLRSPRYVSPPSVGRGLSAHRGPKGFRV